MNVVIPERWDGLLLCGGRGERTGGCDKGLITVDGEAAAARVASRLRALCHRVFISANRNHERYRRFGATAVFSDLREGFVGPLGGLEAAAKRNLQPYLLLAPCDQPLLQPAVLTALQQALLADPALDAVYALAGDRPQYLCAAMRTRCLNGAGALLDSGEHRVRKFYDGLNSRALPLPADLAGSLRNLNDSADWAALGSD
jgi:molybdenum cofactor guanylyltransferase